MPQQIVPLPFLLLNLFLQPLLLLLILFEQVTVVTLLQMISTQRGSDRDRGWLRDLCRDTGWLLRQGIPSRASGGRRGRRFSAGDSTLRRGGRRRIGFDSCNERKKNCCVVSVFFRGNKRKDFRLLSGLLECPLVLGGAFG